jgi:5'-3' exonuclease
MEAMQRNLTLRDTKCNMANHLIVDTSYLIFRSYFANPLFTGKNKHVGEPSGAFFGYAKTVMALIKELEPASLTFALDLTTKTWRAKELESYKAGRPPIEEAMAAQFDVVKEWNKLITRNVLSREGYEADDMIATAARKIRLEKPEDIIYVFSSDRDLYQLLEHHNIQFVKSSKGETVYYGLNNFSSEYGLMAEQWIDYKALVGDNSDNLRGIDGIGPKTACAILKKIGDIHSLIKVLLLDETPFNKTLAISNASSWAENPKNAKWVAKIIEGYDTLKSTYRLAKLSSVEIEPIINGYDLVAGSVLFEDYGFESLLTTMRRSGMLPNKIIKEESNTDYLL